MWTDDVLMCANFRRRPPLYEGPICKNQLSGLLQPGGANFGPTLSRHVLSVDSDGTTLPTQFGRHNYGGSRTNWLGRFYIGGLLAPKRTGRPPIFLHYIVALEDPHDLKKN